MSQYISNIIEVFILPYNCQAKVQSKVRVRLHLWYPGLYNKEIKTQYCRVDSLQVVSLNT